MKRPARGRRPTAPRPAKQRAPEKPRRYRLNASAVRHDEFGEAPVREAITIPTRWVKFVVAFFLLPLCWIGAKTFFDVFAHATVYRDFWATEEFWFFSLGCVLWLIAFFGLPRPIWVYVFGHELTHALWVWLSGGNVSQIHVSNQGGYILSDRKNVWISLAPYFFPIYSILVIALFGIGNIFIDLWPYRRILFALIGGTWGFHLTFTLWMIPKEQPDLLDHGTFFSLVVIFLMNLLVLSVFLVIASADVTWQTLGSAFLENTSDFSYATVHACGRMLKQASQFF